MTVTQSKEIDDLVNGPKVSTPAKQSATAPTTKKQADEKTTTTATTKTTQQETRAEAKPTVPEHRLDTTTLGDDGRKKVMRGGYKINGYRVQVYAGGNSRDARLRAERTGKEINALFPGEPVYVHFYSPRWICRMGNYRTYEEAHQVLSSVKKLGYSSATIVKGKITVPYLPEGDN